MLTKSKHERCSSDQWIYFECHVLPNLWNYSHKCTFFRRSELFLWVFLLCVLLPTNSWPKFLLLPMIDIFSCNRTSLRYYRFFLAPRSLRLERIILFITVNSERFSPITETLISTKLYMYIHSIFLIFKIIFSFYKFQLFSIYFSTFFFSLYHLLFLKKS